jgi:hypothetical protein
MVPFMLKFDHRSEPIIQLVGVATLGAGGGGSWSAGLGVVGGASSAGWTGAGDDVDGEVAFEEILELGAVDEGDAVALGELFAGSAEP